VQSISELHQDDPNIPRHGQCHFLEVLRLFQFKAVELYVGEFADSVDELSNLIAELSADVIFGYTSVLDRIVQQRRHKTLVVHVHAGQHPSHCQRMGDIGLSTASYLPIVGLLGKEIGALYLQDLGFMQVVAQLLLERPKGSVGQGFLGESNWLRLSEPQA
jgi:hypothetical protein